MHSPDSLEDLAVLKHHTTPGGRAALSDYRDLGATLPTVYRVHLPTGTIETRDTMTAEIYHRHGHRVTVE